MPISGLWNKEARTRHLYIWEKRALQWFARRQPVTRPVFICGLQRSGTTMLMNVLHRHPGTEVHDEHADDAFFFDYRIRDWDKVRTTIERSKARAVCFKIISDSHMVADLVRRFADGRFVWIYRDYRDVANSTLRKFGHATRAIRLVCRGESGGGWFQEGLSPDTLAVLRDIGSAHLSDFELLCLVWWARNRICVEQDVPGFDNAMVIRYESLVTDPHPVFSRLFDFAGLEHSRRAVAWVHPHSVSRHNHPPLAAEIETLCDSLQAQLDRYAEQDAGHGRKHVTQPLSAPAPFAVRM